MISIADNVPSTLAKEHYTALDNYLQGRYMQKKYDLIKKFIKDLTNDKFTFETFICASLEEIETQLIPKWAAYSNYKRKKYKKQISSFKTFYGYLGSDTFKLNGVSYNTEYIFSKLNIKVCPYCNENYTYHFSNGKRNYDIEHFYSKVDYPLFAVSFFNLIPSCKVCNFFKNDNPMPILSPHKRYAIDDILKWRIKPKSSDYLYNKDEFDLKLIVNNNSINSNLIDGNLQVFQLENRYCERKDIVADTLKLKQLYDDDYINNVFKLYEGKLFKNLEDVKQMIFNSSLIGDDYLNRPFSKLIKDIFEDIY